MRKHFYLLAFAIALIALPEKANATIILDNYSAGDTLMQFGVGTNSQVTIDSSIYGGRRTDTVTVRDVGGAEFFGAMGFGTNFAIAQGSQDRIYGTMVYDNFKDGDFTQGGLNDMFTLAIAANDVDQPLMDVLSIIVTSGGISESVGVMIPGSSDLPQDVNVAFSEFSNIDFQNITSIELAFDFKGAAGRDFTMFGFGATGFTASVPEPASGMLVGAVLLGFAGRRRRK